MSRVEVLSGPERRRRWSTEQKRSIVAAINAVIAAAQEILIKSAQPVAHEGHGTVGS